MFFFGGKGCHSQSWRWLAALFVKINVWVFFAGEDKGKYVVLVACQSLFDALCIFPSPNSPA